MKHFRGWLARISMALAILAIPAFAAAGSCGSPPDSSGNWHWVDDVAVNMRLMAQGPPAPDTYATVDRETNFTSSTLRNASLSWSGYSSVSYSASLKNWDGKTDSRMKESVRLTVDVPPMKEAVLRIRKISQSDFYRFDAACVWFNAQTFDYRTVIAAYGISGDVDRTWHESSLSIRSLF